MSDSLNALRIDKWLWAARFYKTRSLASDEITLGRVCINGQVVKASREVKVGDRVQIHQGEVQREVQVLGLSALRGPAPVAQLLYQETIESQQARAQAREQRFLAREPALSIEGGRPTKRDRRQLQHNWNDRWSASLDE